MAPKRKDLRTRLLNSFRQEGNCWIWTGACTKDGYGVMGIGRGKQYRAHRVAYEIFRGTIPTGMQVCHTCDTPKCINPAHLFAGTPKENTRDMLNKGRHPFPGSPKIPVEERSKIIEMRHSGMKLVEIASQYGVSFNCISEICLGKRKTRAA
jgi:hypothetical protein